MQCQYALILLYLYQVMYVWMYGRESLLWKVFMWRLSNFYLKNGCSSSSYFKKPFYNKTDEHCYNIRIVPINRVHRGGLVIMSEKETDKTWHRREKKDKERDWQWEYRTGTKRQRLRQTKEDTHSHKESGGGKKREWQNHRARKGQK